MHVLNYSPICCSSDLKHPSRAAFVGAVERGVFVTEAQGLLMVDVYHLGTGLELTPPNLATFCAGRPCVLIAQRFVGCCGETYQGAWVRGEDNLITASGSPGQLWPRHPALDWLHRNGHANGYGWTVAHSVGYYDIIVFAPLDLPGEEIDDSPMMCLKASVPTGWTGIACSWVPLLSRVATTTPVVLDGRLFGALQTWVVGRARNSWNYRTFTEQTRTWASQFKILPTVFPVELADLVERQNVWCWHVITSRSFTLGPIINATDLEASDLNARVARIGTSALSVWEYLKSVGFRVVFGTAIAAGSIACAGAVLAYPGVVPAVCGLLKRAVSTVVLKTNWVKWLLPRPLNIFKFWWSPLVEEVLKTNCLGTIGVTVSDCLLNTSLVPLLHLPSAVMPIWARIPLHYAFNALVHYDNTRNVVYSQPFWRGVLFSAPFALYADYFIIRRLVIRSILATPQAPVYPQAFFAGPSGPPGLLNILGTWWCPIVEELLKTSVPGLLVVTVLDCYVKHNLYPLVHLLTYPFSLPVRLGLHLAVNYLWQFRPSMRNRWAIYSDHIYRSPWAERSLSTCMGRTRFNACEALVPRVCEAYPPAKPRCVDMRLDGVLDHNILPRSNPVFMWLPTQVPVYVPDSNNAMLSLAIEQRILCAPPLAPLVQKVHWAAVSKWLCEAILPVDSPDMGERGPLVEAWLSNMSGSAFRRAQEGLKMHNLGLVIDRKVMLFTKTDEGLVRPSLVFKPRIIANVEPSVQVISGPYIHLATMRLHKFWDGDTVLNVKKRQYSLTLGCGATDLVLDRWLSQSIARADAGVRSIIVAGDDSVVLSKVNSTYFVVCADASGFDQSQSFGPLHFERKILRRLGVPREATAQLKKLANSYYVGDRNRGSVFRIDRRKRPIRDTGGSDTTIGNSINMMAAWVWALSSVGEDLGALEQFFAAEVGFKMKMFNTGLSGINFLKGTWLPGLRPGSDCDRVWVPLPSRFLKFGKFLVHPQSLHPNVPLLEAVLLEAANLAEQYWQYENIPLIGPFVTRYRRRDVAPIAFPSWHVQFNSARRCVPYDANQFFADYYHVGVEDFRRVDRLIAASAPFEFLEDPLFTVLGRADYDG